MKTIALLLITLGLISLSLSSKKQNSQHINESIKLVELKDFCAYYFSHEKIAAKENTTIVMYKQCDSMKIYFPSGGTITSASLYKDSTRKELIARTPSFVFQEKKSNFMTVSSKLKGEYFVYYASCHWGSSFTINFKH